MPEFCDVAVPVRWMRFFTYRVPEGMEPVWAGACWCPFASSACRGSWSELHDRKPSVQTKNVCQRARFGARSRRAASALGKWIADYYLAPIGEVFRTMLPLVAEFKRSISYRITEAGTKLCIRRARRDRPARSRQDSRGTAGEIRVLDFLAQRDSASEASLRVGTRGSQAVACGHGAQEMDCARGSSRTRATQPARSRVAVLKSAEGKLNANQQDICRYAQQPPEERRQWKLCRSSLFPALRWQLW